MKIGLLTTYSFNYGSYYQAVALQKKLQEMGHECELINEKTKMTHWMNLFCLYLFDPILPQKWKGWIADRIPSYCSFLRIKNDTKTLKVSPSSLFSFSQLSKRYDCVIVGSDELWSASRESIRFCPEYFGYLWKCPIISYATCAIKLDMKKKGLRTKAKNGLTRFLALSVRDTISQKKIEAITGNAVSVVLDPTLLHPFFVEFHQKETASEKYILLYGQHYHSDQKKFIQAFAKKEHARLYSVGWKQDWSEKFLDVQTAKELQQVFREAFFCFPSTFHGTVFSILNHKQFVAMLDPVRGKKVELLLKQFHLTDRIFTNQIDLSHKIDYKQVELLLEEQRRESECYLKEALEKVQRRIENDGKTKRS